MCDDTGFRINIVNIKLYSSRILEEFLVAMMKINKASF